MSSPGMLTGALAPTEGTATVVGKDIRSNMGEIRKSVGICLQHDCLFPELTVKEHIQFFSRIKGLYNSMDKEEAEAHVEQVIQDVALYEKRNTFSRNLSGGMKRKLSVAIAFCGGSKTILLDEVSPKLASLQDGIWSFTDKHYISPRRGWILSQGMVNCLFHFVLNLSHSIYQEVYVECYSAISSGSLHYSYDPLYGKYFSTV